MREARESDRFAQWSEPRANLFRKELRLFPGREVPAPVQLVEVDKVGRILVTQNLRAFLGIESGELTVAGQGDYFEVWTPAEWKSQMDKLQDVEANEQRFSTLDLSKNNGS